MKRMVRGLSHYRGGLPLSGGVRPGTKSGEIRAGHDGINRRKGGKTTLLHTNYHGGNSQQLSGGGGGGE